MVSWDFLVALSADIFIDEQNPVGLCREKPQSHEILQSEIHTCQRKGTILNVMRVRCSSDPSNMDIWQWMSHTGSSPPPNSLIHSMEVTIYQPLPTCCHVNTPPVRI